MVKISCVLLMAFSMVNVVVVAQKSDGVNNDSNTPLHLLQPEYKVPYKGVKPQQVKAVMDRILVYLDRVTPPLIVNSKTGKDITDFKKPIAEAALMQGDFRLTSYEWGVTYSGMILAGQLTGDKKYTDYAASRMKFLSDAATYFTQYAKDFPKSSNALSQVLFPHALDDAGAICAAMIKAQDGKINSTLQPLIDNYMTYIMTKEYRLKDGTLARNIPYANTLWLDDMYMSIPAIAQMGKHTGDKKYFDEAVKQIRQFSSRMFNREKGLYMHGWVENMKVHPEFHWARANGWALMAKIETLEVLPEDHPGRSFVLQLLQEHIIGLARLQSGDGLWHQLLDRHDSYLETSASAMYSFSIAHAINRGWIDRAAHAPMALLAWNAVAQKVNDRGQVEGTCVGTAMGFEPAFYYYRPVNVYAAHGYGPVLLAGAAVYKLLSENSQNEEEMAIIFTK
jgi:unsaturated rhamnogalacturonyl hydrolase